MRYSLPDKAFYPLLRPFWVLTYYFGLALFASLALLVNLCALISAMLPGQEWKVTVFQWMIQKLSLLCFGFFRITGILRVECRGFEAIETRRGVPKPVIIANHPCLFDVFLFYLRLPRLTCIYKASLKKTLIQAEMGNQIGFVSNADPRQMIRDAAAKVKAGEQMLIFPEATRTETQPLNPFKLGAASIAQLGGVGVQTVFIFTNSNVLSKECSFFSVPTLPIRVHLEVGECFHPDDFRLSQDLNRALEDYFKERLAHGPNLSTYEA